jgi:hypothetical protein
MPKKFMILLQEIERNIVHSRFIRKTANNAAAVRVFSKETLCTHLSITIQKGVCPTFLRVDRSINEMHKPRVLFAIDVFCNK